MRRVKVPEPSHLRLREPETAVAVKPVRGKVHLRGVGAVDRDETGDLAALGLGQTQRSPRRRDWRRRNRRRPGPARCPSRPSSVAEHGDDLVDRQRDRDARGARLYSIWMTRPPVSAASQRAIWSWLRAAHDPAAAVDEDQRRRALAGIVDADCDRPGGVSTVLSSCASPCDLGAARGQHGIFVDPQAHPAEIEGSVVVRIAAPLQIAFILSDKSAAMMPSARPSAFRSIKSAMTFPVIQQTLTEPYLLTMSDKCNYQITARPDNRPQSAAARRPKGATVKAGRRVEERHDR